jgi:hypothetical protein
MCMLHCCHQKQPYFLENLGKRKLYECKIFTDILLELC